MVNLLVKMILLSLQSRPKLFVVGRPTSRTIIVGVQMPLEINGRK